MDSHRHRSGGLKQSNKPFKSKHASKNALKEKSKGKINRTSIKQRGQGPSNKADRRHAARVAQQKKRSEVYETTRVFEGKDGAPKIVAVLPLCPDVDMDLAIQNLYKAVDQPVPQTPGPLNMQSERFKHKFQFVPLQRNFIDVMDAMKVADFTIMLMSAEVEVDKFGITCLLGVLNQGLVSPIPVVQHLERTSPKIRTNIKKSLVAFVQQFYPEEARVHTLDTEAEAMTVLRMLATQRPRAIQWREQHPYLLAENVEFEEHEGELGTLKVTGVARGCPFNANRLVHLQNYGDFQIEKIMSAPVASAQVSDMQEDSAVLDIPNPEEQDDLVSENEPDFMENEQTWPTEEELAEADERVRQMNGGEDAQGKVKKLVPKGTSAYQAAWIVDEEDEYSDVDEDEDDQDMMEDDDDENVEPAGADTGFPSFDDDEEYELIDMNGKDKTEEDDEFDAEEEDRQLQEYLARQKELKAHTDFPDEVDTPLDTPARVRFARYRGLQSFRTSPWDPYENLPIDYSRIFQYENYNRTKNRILTQNLVGKFRARTRITLYIKDVPKEAYESYSPSRPFVVFGLLQYEHKMTVLNFQITRDNAYEEPVKSKDAMILHMGFRRIEVRPIYSQRGNGKGHNNVHKYERFLQMGKPSVATIYAPTVFGKVPCLLYKETDDVNDPILVSVGSFMDTDTRRIVAKRIILSGHPYKIHKRSAVIRFMFFNTEDVHWFKPVQLTTKYGRTGHIKESLGTHGYVKCMFDGPITQQDTVMMYLYKRVFPKWNTKLWKGGLNHAISVGGESKAMEIDAMEE
ncbi:hypothetical protein INT44_005607 [Umbelopsis vinacea]|uniref:Bms1-type G domain-containing protein n=1 Tax=Umbelopsis vinacea TaxID=44442 RepID=A0A8H7PYL1_9FUNG|nr:hypothetical protein INT44_005607 [Umbelopsis vinacea]